MRGQRHTQWRGRLAPALERQAYRVGMRHAARECFVDGERVRPQAGGFYAGWITSELVGPFKGDPGTSGW